MSSASDPQRPNLLLITTDQQRFDTIRAGGNPHIRTPHLDWLVGSGIHFRRCYADSPVCVTSRATLITGQHWSSLKPYGNWTTDTAPDPSRTLPGLLTAQGYQTRAVGKMHYHPPRRNYGWEHMEILQDYYRYTARHPHLGIPMDHGMGQNEMEPVISTVPETHSLTRWIVERSIDFLETRDESRPFLLYTSFSKPHPPFDPCASYWELYRNATMPPPVYGDWSKTPQDVPASFLEPTWRLSSADTFSSELLADVRRAYYALITQIDYNLGILFARLRELDLLENTLILFTADHGEMLGDHHMGAKSVFFEGSAHVPLIVRPPQGVLEEERGTACDALTCLADVMPTFLGTAGSGPPADLPMDGIDLLAAARGESNREVFFGEYTDYHCAIAGDLKYLYTTAGGAELAFDLARDPYEQRDLLTAGEKAEEVARLRSLLTEHLARLGHDAVKEGRLAVLRPAPDRRACRRNSWPGLHTRHELKDVLH